MARPREFDEDAALDAAVLTFWEHGYDGASLSDLTAATGVGRQSLYLAFGDKQHLYHQALDRYRERFFTPLVAAIEESADVRVALRDMLMPIVDGTCDDQPAGCLLVSAATERAQDDRQVRLRVGAAFAGLEAALFEAAQRSKAAGLAAETFDAAGWAALVVATIQGLQVMAAAEVPRATLIRALDAALAVLHP